MNRRRLTSVITAVAVVGVTPLVMSPPGSATAAPAATGAPAAKKPGDADRDNRPDALRTQRITERTRALDALAAGDAKLRGKGADRIIATADGDEVPYPATQTSQLLTFLVEFGDDNTGSPFPDVTGPAAGEIPEPARSDNTTYWKPDFDRQHFMDMFFNGMPEQDGESFHNVYKEMSSGRFDLKGDVSDWVKVDKTSATYNDAAGEETQAGMTSFIQDSADAWFESQQTAGKSEQEILDYLKTFDVWDRYDLDGDGVTDEPDGYIDHFQAIHAGEGEEAGAPPWAIWSHRWAANQAGFGQDGPEASDDCTACFPAGGIEIGDTGFWIRDYTTEPENGGLGVFAHEFGHDLGLPDYYDTKQGDNGTGYWTLMSSGSWLNHGKDAIGTTPNHMGPKEKRFLGWYGADDLATIDIAAGETGKVTLGPSYHANTVGKQAVLINLPDGSHEVATPSRFGTGSYLYSGQRDAYDATATSPAVAVPAGGQLTARAYVHTEADFDYVYLQASTDGGQTFTNVTTSLSDAGNPNGVNLGGGMSGDSGGWVDLTADLSDFGGQSVVLRTSYITDENTHGEGFALDDLAVGSYTSNFDNANDWELDGWYAAKDGGFQANYPQTYMAENRQYVGYDATLSQGPYLHNYVRSSNNKRVDHYPYQDGLLVWYQNGLYGDNNTREHPGYGQSLPVDSHPDMLTWSDGSKPNGRAQSYDATFDVDQTDGLSMTAELPTSGTKSMEVAANPGISTFDDSDTDAYWDSDNPWVSTKVAGTGTVIEVLSSDEESGKMEVQVGSKAPVATEQPVVTGTATVGETLTVSDGAWDLDDPSISYQWYSDGAPITGAHSATYQLQPQDVGNEVTAVVTATVDGSLPGMAEADAVGPVAKAATTIAGTVPVKIKKGVRGNAKFTIDAPFTPTGKVTVKFGNKRLTKPLVNGKVRFTLPKVGKKGVTTLVATYSGAAAFEKSKATFKVKIV